MPEKRPEIVEDVKSTQTIPDVYETWLKKQVKARQVSVGFQGPRQAELAEEDREEDKIDRAERLHEKAHRRKRSRGSAN